MEIFRQNLQRLNEEQARVKELKAFKDLFTSFLSDEFIVVLKPDYSGYIVIKDTNYGYEFNSIQLGVNKDQLQKFIKETEDAVRNFRREEESRKDNSESGNEEIQSNQQEESMDGDSNSN